MVSATITAKNLGNQLRSGSSANLAAGMICQSASRGSAGQEAGAIAFDATRDHGTSCGFYWLLLVKERQ